MNSKTRSFSRPKMLMNSWLRISRKFTRTLRRTPIVGYSSSPNRCVLTLSTTNLPCKSRKSPSSCKFRTSSTSDLSISARNLSKWKWRIGRRMNRAAKLWRSQSRTRLKWCGRKFRLRRKKDCVRPSSTHRWYLRTARRRSGSAMSSNTRKSSTRSRFKTTSALVIFSHSISRSAKFSQIRSLVKRRAQLKPDFKLSGKN